MKRSAAALLALVAGALACAGVQVSHDFDPTADFSSYQSFDWFPGGRELTGDVQLDSPLIDERVRAAIGRTLTLKGYRKVADRTPDFYVNYHLSVQTRLDSSGMNTYYGVGTYGSWGGVSIGSGTRLREYDEGTLVIDVVDAGSRKLVWRGTGSKALSSTTTPEQTTRTIDEATEKILERFPPQA